MPVAQVMPSCGGTSLLPITIAEDLVNRSTVLREMEEMDPDSVLQLPPQVSREAFILWASHNPQDKYNPYLSMEKLSTIAQVPPSSVQSFSSCITSPAPFAISVICQLFQ